MSNNNILVIGIAGGTGSGKSTLTKQLVNHFGDQITVLKHDDYYKAHDEMTYEERTHLNYDHPNAFDTELLVKQLKDLLDWKTIEKPIYDYTEHTRSSEVEKVEPKEVIILEGILVLNDPALRDLMDIKIFVDTDDDIRIIRRIQRDIEERGRSLQSVIDQYKSTVKPMYHQFIEPTKRYADIIVPEGGENQVAIDLLVTKVRDILRKREK